MEHNPEACTGCLNCQLVCSFFHEGECNPSLSRVTQQACGDGFRAVFSVDCDECGRCADFCPYGAMSRSGD